MVGARKCERETRERELDRLSDRKRRSERNICIYIKRERERSDGGRKREWQRKRVRSRERNGERE